MLSSKYNPKRRARRLQARQQSRDAKLKATEARKLAEKHFQQYLKNLTLLSDDEQEEWFEWSNEREEREWPIEREHYILFQDVEEEERTRDTWGDRMSPEWFQIWKNERRGRASDKANG